MDKEIPINKIVAFRIKSSFIGNELSDRAKQFSRINQNVIIYSEESFHAEPSYLKQFFQIQDKDKLKSYFTSSAKLVVIVKNIGKNKEELAFSFGSGRYLLKTDSMDVRFGLRTALNIIDSDEVKNFSKTVLESNPKNAKEQLAKTANASEFGISSEQDLIKGLTGKIKSKWATKLGTTAAGSESLSLRLHCNIHTISDVANDIIEAYESDEYKKDFDWVDQIQDVKDKEETKTLNDRLIQILSTNSSEPSNTDKVWAAVPDYIDYVDVYQFRFGDNKRAKKYDDIEKAYIIEALGNNISLESLKGLKISAISAEDESKTLDRWNAYKCLYAEITSNNKVFLLINGRWYEIANDFCKQINKSYEDITKKHDFIDYHHEREAEYNKELANVLGGKCYDGENIPYGSSHSKIEVCDVQTREGDLIHVKKYTGSSALSHLFNQGYVSGELIRNDPAFLRKAEEITGGNFHNDSNKKRKVIFAIITSKIERFDIPFFSKVTLRNINRQLSGLGYKVEIQLIKNIANE